MIDLSSEKSDQKLSKIPFSPAETVIALNSNLHWMSILTRLTIGTVFLCAAIAKAPLGVFAVISYYASLQGAVTSLGLIVRFHVVLILFLEFSVALWLFSGFRLRFAWIFAALLLVGFGVVMIFVGKCDVASENYFYVLLCEVGLLTSGFDRWALQPRAAGRCN